jgi:hypothetical protein
MMVSPFPGLMFLELTAVTRSFYLGFAPRPQG